MLNNNVEYSFADRLFLKFPVLGKYRHSALSDSIVFILGNYVGAVFGFLSSFIIRHFLGPITMGLFSELMLITEYGKFHHLGIINAIEREIPFYNGKKAFQRVEVIKKIAFKFVLFSSLNAGLVLFALSFFWKGHQTGLQLTALVIMAETAVSFYQSLLHSYKQFKISSLFLVIISFVSFLLKVSLLMLFGLNGLLAALILTAAFTAFLYKNGGHATIDLSVPVAWKEVLRLLKMGIPLVSYRIMHVLSSSVDRLVIIFFLGRLQLGYYSIALMVYNYLTMTPRFSFRVLAPRLMETFGKTGDIQDLKKYLLIPSRLFGCFFAVLIGLVILTTPFCIQTFLPSYRDGILPAQFMAVSTFFVSFIFTWNYLLIALYKQTRLALLYAFGAALTLIMNLGAIYFFENRLAGVAAATLVSQFLFSSLFICYGFRHYTRKFREHLKLLLSFYYPLIWVGLAWLQMRQLDIAHLSVREGGVRTLWHILLFLMVCSPLVYHVLKNIRHIHKKGLQ